MHIKIKVTTLKHPIDWYNKILFLEVLCVGRCGDMETTLPSFNDEKEVDSSTSGKRGALPSETGNM